MATYTNIVPDTTTGLDAATSLNAVGSSSEMAIKVISEIANISAEIGYFNTNTIIYSLGEKAWYKYDGASWVQTPLYIQAGEDSSSANAANVGKMRYRISGSNSYCEICMQTGVATFSWIVLVENNW